MNKEVEVVETSTVDTAFLAELNKELPKDTEQCFKLMEQDIMASVRYSTLRFWHIGKIADTLETRGEKNVIPRLVERTKYEDRHLRYALAVYRGFPDVRKVYTLCEKGVSWTAFKDLLKIREEDERTKLVSGLESGKIEPEEIPESVEKAQAKTEKKEEEGIKPPKAVKFFEKISSTVGVQYNKLQEVFVPVPDYIDFIDNEHNVDDDTYQRCASACQETIKKLKLLKEYADKQITNLENEVIAHVNPVKTKK